MNGESIAESRLRITRRRALAAGGGLALSALLAGCGFNAGGARSSGSDTGAATSAAGGATSTGSDRALALLDRAATCTLTPEQTEGPYYLALDAVRPDVRDGRPGTTLELVLRVQELPSCKPLGQAVVEIWHCDAGGVYSGFAQQSIGAGGSSEDLSEDDGRFLRGAQVTDGTGLVRLTTIYPGWYRGRTPHIHLKVHLDQRTLLTTQLYFDDALSDRVYATPPYADRGERDTRNTNDGIFETAGLLTMEASDDGYLGVLNLGVERSG